jgi:SAM-dependent methyltransferase
LQTAAWKYWSNKMLDKTNLSFDESAGLWRASDGTTLSYSDGAATEAYLKEKFSEVQDLSSSSYELQAQIKDWPSEYHLSRKRAQLLAGFQFDRSKTVLEVGAGCGSISRLLGERFDQVISVEGSAARAELAAMRTRDLQTVTVVSAPFQDVKFSRTFDMIFCIGVLEYSGSFMGSEGDPYAHALAMFSDLLSADGVLVLAIENQFGLKYWAGCREDHTGRVGDGLEGYNHKPDTVKTFGYGELKGRLQVHFPNTEFYFPCPDYKMPSAVLAEKMGDSVSMAGLMASFPACDYGAGPARKTVDEVFVWPQLEKAGLLPHMANSFLVMASKGAGVLPEMDGLGIYYSSGRPREFETITRIVAVDGNINTLKSLTSGEDSHESGPLTNSSCDDPWVDGTPLHHVAARILRVKGATLGQVFEPLAPWLKAVKAMADESGRVPGAAFDAIPRNAFVLDGRVVFVDQEWQWHKSLSANTVIIRGLYHTLKDFERLHRLPLWFHVRSAHNVIDRAAAHLGVNLTGADFDAFYALEREQAVVMSGRSGYNHIVSRLWFHGALRWIYSNIKGAALLTRRAVSRVQRILSI